MSNKQIEEYDFFVEKKVLDVCSVKLSNNTKTDYYFNTKKIYSNPYFMNLIAEKIVKKINNYTQKNNIDYEHVVGVPYGCIPLASIVSHKLDKSNLFTRKESKTYGTQKLIEGNYEIGDSVILIEDVITSGSSIMETVRTLENNGLLVSYVVVLFNRETGGLADTIQNCNIPIDYIYNISRLSNYLHVKKSIDDFDYGKIISSMAVDKKNYINMIEDKKIEKELVESKIERNKKYEYVFDTQLNTILMGIIVNKKTALCLSLDVSKWSDAKIILDLCGPYICMVKLHSDLFSDIIEIDVFIKELKCLARKHQFLIMEDIKLADVDKITYSKITNSFFKYNKWANYITVHGLTSQSLINYKEELYKNEETNKNKETKKEQHFANMCLVSQMNQNVSLCNESYSNECFKILGDNDNFSPVVVCQNSGENNILNRIKLTPGVKLNLSQTDLKNRRYRDIKSAIVEEDNHIIIVGSDIVNCYIGDKDNKQEKLLEKGKLYSSISYKYFIEKHGMVVDVLKDSNVNKQTIFNMFNEVFKISGEEEDIIIKEENLKQREENMIIKEHDLFTKEVSIGTKYEQLIKQRYDMYHTQMVLYSIMMFLTIIFNYDRVIDYLL
jgi:uridine monophosphate synthetase